MPRVAATKAGGGGGAHIPHTRAGNDGVCGNRRNEAIRQATRRGSRWCAAQKPRSEDDFKQLRAVPNGFIRSKHGQGLVDAIKEALANPDAFAPELTRPVQNAQIPAGAPELLKVLLKHVSDENDVVPRLIANSSDIDRIARGETSEDIAAMTGWRYEMFGKKAIALLSGKLAVSFNGGQVSLFDV